VTLTLTDSELVHHKPCMRWSGRGPPRWEAGDWHKAHTIVRLSCALGE